MLKPTRTVLALAAGSLVLGLAGAGAAVADEEPMPDMPGHESVVADDEPNGENGENGYGHALGVVVSHGKLNVRSRPSTYAYKVGVVYPHQKLEIECKKRGERVGGNDLWYRLDGKDDMNGEPKTAAKNDEDRWVAARYVKNVTHVKWCY
ncbi:SH3 domain-containing protein [Streptomyces sp. NPDC051183]|uniref:SH3 domain-containing protein n=1 Tax=unclassified Streptomyces TaxID=2593676 RepID=UPI00342F888A